MVVAVVLSVKSIMNSPFFISKAIQKCGRIKDNVGNQYKCYEKVFSNKVSLSMCNQIQDISYQYSCYGHLATTEQCLAACDKITNLENKYDCYATVAQVRKDASICSRIPEQDAKDSCNYFVNLSNNISTPILKPVIYLYPEKIENVKVSLNYHGQIIASYPAYDTTLKGWEVTAYPDGYLINNADKKEYSYLFWEGQTKLPVNWDLTNGFVVKGQDTIPFLQDTLSKMGLTPREYNEFIVYWYPRIKDNPYNLIHFADKEYTDTAPLTITPTPDSLLRVFMVYKPLTKNISIEPQTINPFVRKGFTAVEWGGTEIK